MWGSINTNYYKPTSSFLCYQIMIPFHKHCKKKLAFFLLTETVQLLTMIIVLFVLIIGIHCAMRTINLTILPTAAGMFPQ